MFFLEIGSEKSDLKIVIWESDLRKPPSWAEFSKGTWFFRRLSLNLLKTTFFLEIGSEMSDLKIVIWENQNYQKEYGIYIYIWFLKRLST